TRTRRQLPSQLALSPHDGVPVESVVNFDTIHTLRRSAFRRQVSTLTDARMAQACRALRAAVAC
ncbi:MAG: type II toxin-antitoxin system PemK/MazF family toxin, partial [Acidimicrobiales bacterium]